MSGEQIRLQIPPKLFIVNSWIAQMIKQWIPDSWSGHRKCTGATRIGKLSSRLLGPPSNKAQLT